MVFGDLGFESSEIAAGEVSRLRFSGCPGDIDLGESQTHLGICGEMDGIGREDAVSD
jgi:hypothetical protein